MSQNSTNITKLKAFIPIFFSGETILFLGSLISFPILTRLLTKTDYGLMGLVTITLLILENIFSGGMRQSVLRFYEEYRNEKRITAFFSSIFNFSIILGAIGIVVYLAVIWLLCQLTIIQRRVALLFVFVSILILIRLGLYTQQAFLRIQERALAVNVVDISARYGGIILSILMILHMHNLYGFYSGLIIAECCIALLLYFNFGRHIYRLSIDKEIVIKSLKYGYPLMISGLAVYLLGVGDQYIIACLMTKDVLANYIVAYSFSRYGIEIVKNVCIYSFQPLIMNAWNRDDIGEGNALLSNYIRIFSMFAFPVAFGLIAIRQEGVELLAGAKYSNVSYLVPILVAGIFMNGLDFVSNAGFLYRKKTRMAMFLTFGTATINIFLNLMLLPIMGLMGAAVATLASYFLYAVVGITYSSTLLKFRIPWFNVGRYALFSLFMFGVLTYLPIETESLILDIITKIVIGGLIYTSSILCFERHLIKRIISG